MWYFRGNICDEGNNTGSVNDLLNGYVSTGWQPSNVGIDAAPDLQTKNVCYL